MLLGCAITSLSISPKRAENSELPQKYPDWSTEPLLEKICPSHDQKPVTGYGIQFYPTKVPADQDWPQIQEAGPQILTKGLKAKFWSEC